MSASHNSVASSPHSVDHSIASFLSRGNNGVVFNEMKQKLGLNVTLNFTFTKRGPEHIPIFLCSGTAVLKYGGTDYQIKDQAEAQNKKEAKNYCLGFINKRILKIVHPAPLIRPPAQPAPFQPPQSPGYVPVVSPRHVPQPSPRYVPPQSPGHIPIQISIESNQPKPKFIEHHLKVAKQPTSTPPPAHKFTSTDVYYTPSGKEGIVGAGGFGKVFCVVKKGEEDKLLALKIPNREHTDPYYQQKFETELQLHTKAQENEFVATIIGTTYVQRIRGVVMEYCSRGSLFQLIRQQNIAPSLICRIHRDITKAIRYLHEHQDTKRITHNDLKPDNILLTDDFRARLCDFGASNIATQTFLRSQTDRFVKGKVTYTAFFISPERDIHPDVMPNKVSDIYSFGVCLYACLSLVYEKGLPFYRRFKAHKREMTRPIRERLYQLENNKVTEPSGDNKAEAEILYDLLQLIHFCCIHKADERPDIDEVFGKIELCCRDNEVEKLAPKVVRHLERVYPKNIFKYDKNTWVNIEQIKL